MKILVTGGAGYIGSFMVKALLERGHELVVFDNLKRGHREAVDSQAVFVEGDIKDRESVDLLFEKNKFEAVMHFAGLISVEESTKNPDLYYQNNVVGSKNLFELSINHGIRNLIFSSSAAVYGNPNQVPIPEDHPKNPTSPYGATKLQVEELLAKLAGEHPEVGFVCLRYFNAAGGALDGSLGEDHNPETHIIPLAIQAVLLGREFNLFGTDYDTPDGTCIRDYIHVIDLVDAHILALEKLQKNPGGYFYNVGTGFGFSNREVINTVEAVGGKKINIVQKKSVKATPPN